MIDRLIDRSNQNLKALKPLISIYIPKGLETLNLSLLKAWKIDLKIRNIYILNES